MKGNLLLDKMELIDDTYVEAADKIPNNKKHTWIKFTAMAACLALVVFATTKIISLETTQDIIQVSSQLSSQGNDYTIKLKALDTKKYKKQIKNATLGTSASQYRFPYLTISDVCNNSTQIVNCNILNTEFISVNSEPYTKLDVEILEPLKGNLNKNDKISVLLYGGYINKAEYLTVSRNTPKDSNEIIEIKDFDARFEPYPKKGETYLLFVREADWTPVLKNAYFSTTSYYTIYKLDENNKYTRLIGYNKQENIEHLGNSVESFDLSWLKNEIEKLK